MDWDDLFGQEERKRSTDWSVIPGLKLIRRAFSHDEQMKIVNAIIANHHFSDADGINQSMCFGTLPDYLAELSDWVRKQPDLLPGTVLQREPLFDQAIMNLYRKGQGILSHVDLARFQDGIVILSLMSSCVMTMRPARLDKKDGYVQQDGEPTEDDDAIDIMLHPGDILALSGPARYEWEHGIEERMIDVIDGEHIERSTRVSVTLRKMIA